jgi:Undecaprenyl-phosphate galactose phosphotransferase WbaP
LEAAKDVRPGLRIAPIALWKPRDWGDHMSRVELDISEDALEEVSATEEIVNGLLKVPPPAEAPRVGAAGRELNSEIPVDALPSLLPDAPTFLAIVRRVMRTAAPLLTADVLGLVASGILAGALVSWLRTNDFEFVHRVAAFALLPLLVAFWFNDLYSEIWVHPAVELRQLAHLTTFGLSAAAIGGIAVPSLPLWCLFAWPTAIVLVPSLRTLARRICSEQSWWGYPTLVIGNSSSATAVVQTLLDAPRSGLRPVVISDPQQQFQSAALPVVNDNNALKSVIRARAIRHAVVSLPDLSASKLTDMLDRYSGLVPHLLVLSDDQTLPSLWGASRSSGRLSGIEVRNALLMATLQGVKRVLDLAVAMVFLIPGAPLMLLIAVLVKLTSRGPAIYGHQRIGRHGRYFKAWKFRTMYRNGDDILREYLAANPAAREEWDRDQKLRDDPRVTWFGRILRKTSLDELPQIWNVLIGNMSLVGPRPIVKSEARRYANGIRLYISVKPGITGLWQVSGRNDTSYEDRIQLDLFYIRHWSPWLDIYILAKTTVALISRDGAY